MEGGGWDFISPTCCTRVRRSGSSNFPDILAWFSKNGLAESVFHLLSPNCSCSIPNIELFDPVRCWSFELFLSTSPTAQSSVPFSAPFSRELVDIFPPYLKWKRTMRYARNRYFRRFVALTFVTSSALLYKPVSDALAPNAMGLTFATAAKLFRTWSFMGTSIPPRWFKLPWEFKVSASFPSLSLLILAICRGGILIAFSISGIRGGMCFLMPN